MDFVPVKSFDTYILAHIWQSRLEQEGFRCYLKDEYTVTIDPILTNAVGGIKLCVPSIQAERALALIKTFELENAKRVTCPKCNTQNVEYITQPNNSKNWITAIATWLLGSYAVSYKKIYHCYQCKFEFDEIPETVSEEVHT
jgi:DNA-directed RNA polymerase subunit RPC12/RpoP